MLRKAKVLSRKEIDRVKHATRDSPRNRCAFMLSLLAGLRAGEIASLNLGDVFAHGKVLDRIVLQPTQTKGNTGRIVFVSTSLQDELANYHNTLSRVGQRKNSNNPLIISKKGKKAFTSHGMVMLLKRIYQQAKITGASSHSGRRSFITTLANKGITVRVLQELAGHKHIGTTQGYIDVNDDMLRKAVEAFHG